MSIDFLGELRRIQNMDVNETFDEATDSLEALQAMLARITILLGGAATHETFLYEGWQDELGIDFTVWTATNPATGAVWARAPDAAGEYLVVSAAPNANEVGRIRSNQRWQAIPTVIDTNTVIKRMVLEFEMRITNLANLDNTLCFFGLTPGIGSTRAANDIIGFALVGAGNALQTVTNNGGIETVNTGFAENLANMNKFKIDAYEDHVKFYLNEVEIADHITNLPDLVGYINFFFDTTAGGACTPEIGIVRIRLSDVAPA